MEIIKEINDIWVDKSLKCHLPDTKKIKDEPITKKATYDKGLVSSITQRVLFYKPVRKNDEPQQKWAIREKRV